MPEAETTSVPDLDFRVEGAEPLAFAAAPQIAFKLRVFEPSAADQAHTAIHNVVLRSQIQIEPAARSYAPGERERLPDLFGAPQRWGQTLRPMLWAHASAVVPAFTVSTTLDLPVPCTFDFNVAVTKYFHSLQNGDVPLRLLFSGTIFYQPDGAPLRVAPIPWHKEATFRLPVRVWRAMMDLYYPNTAWLCLGRDVFERLHDYKTRHSLPTWEQAMESLLRAAEIAPAAGEVSR